MKKLINTISLALTFVLLKIESVSAYTLDSSFKPRNAPFDLADEIKTLGGGSEGAVGGFIIILQIISGGLLYFAAPVAVIMIVVAAFNMTINGHESEQLEQSKKHLTWAIIGLFVIILSYSIARAVINFVLETTAA